MGVVQSKFFALYDFSPRLAMISLATFLYIYVRHGMPQIRGKNGLMEKKKNPWKPGLGRKAVGIVGLKNFGNTCYFNAVIQALASCKLFCAWIERRNQMNIPFEKEKKDQTDDNDNELTDDEDEESTPEVPFPVIAALHEAFSLINAIAFAREPCLSEMIASNLICAFTKHNQEAVKKSRMYRFVLNSHEEQDAHEAFNYIMGTIADECSNIQKTQLSSTNVALDDASFLEAFETGDQNETPAFFKVTKKLCWGSGPSGDSTNQEDVEFVEEEEPTFTMTPFREMNLIHSPTRTPSRKQHRFQFIIPEDEDPIRKGKRSKKYWRGGSIVSRADVHEEDIKEDRKLTQNLTFDGTLGVKLVCMACNAHYPIKLDRFNCLILTIPKGIGCPKNLEDLILYNLRPIQVHDVNCDGCLRNFGRPTTSSFAKFTAIGKMPQTLCIHINRSEWTRDGNGVPVKRNEHVPFPLYLNIHKLKRISDLLNRNPSIEVPTYDEMSKMIDQRPDKKRKITDYDYLLRAVICHSGGSADSGHFITYRQSSTPNSNGEGWYVISDSELRAVSSSTVLNCKAYMVFYEKRLPTTKAMLDLIPSFGRKLHFTP